MSRYRVRIRSRRQVGPYWLGYLEPTVESLAATLSEGVVRQFVTDASGNYELEGAVDAAQPHDALNLCAEALARHGLEIAEAVIVDQLRSLAEGAAYGVIVGGGGASPTRKLVAVGFGAGVGAAVGATLGWIFGTPGATYDLQCSADGIRRLTARTTRLPV